MPTENANLNPGGDSGTSSYTLGEIAVLDGHKAFGVTRALDGVTIRARRGEIHAVVGENGCGKSTLAKALSGVLPLDSGTVSLFGETPSTPHEARELGIATVFQEVLVANEASVVENLYIGSDTLWTKKLPVREKKDAAAKVMEELVGHSIDPDAVVGTLPLSVKQWITIARALLRDPTVLILDESSAALDLDATERLFNKMRELRDGGAAVFIVTHRIAELIRISDRATVLRDGYDVGVLESGEITERNLLRLMTGEAPATSAAQKTGPEPKSEQVVLSAERLRVWENGAPIDFSLREGEVVGIAGLDGQGQDEFVRVLSGIAPSVEGVPQVRTADGEKAPVRGLGEAMKAGISYVSGDRKREGILPNLSIYENLLLPQYRRHRLGWILGLIRWHALSGIFDREVDRFSIKVGDRANRITSLSGGNQQKLMIGRSFALKPKILVLNDPARGIDIGSKEEIYRQMREYAHHGNSVIYLSTEIEEFIGLCSRVVVFRHGSIFDAFEGQEIDTHRILEAMFGQSSGAGVDQRSKRPASAAEAGSKPVKIIDFGEEDKEMLTKDDIGPIKIKDFGRSDGVREADDSKDGRDAGSSVYSGVTTHDTDRQSSLSLPGDPVPPKDIKIIDYDEEHAEKELRKQVGSMKIIDVDKEAERERDREWRRTRDAHDSGVGRIKIIESDA